MFVMCTGYIVKNVYTWCGKVENVDDGPGMDFDSCLSWGSCAGDKLVASESFWKALSAHVRFTRLIIIIIIILIIGLNRFV